MLLNFLFTSNVNFIRTIYHYSWPLIISLIFLMISSFVLHELYKTFIQRRPVNPVNDVRLYCQNANLNFWLMSAGPGFSRNFNSKPLKVLSLSLSLTFFYWMAAFMYYIPNVFLFRVHMILKRFLLFLYSNREHHFFITKHSFYLNSRSNFFFRKLEGFIKKRDKILQLRYTRD